jgi:hypothetical protein
MERETGIEPATNSLEGCDSTTELLPPTCSLASLALRRASPPYLYRFTAPTAARSAAVDNTNTVHQKT